MNVLFHTVAGGALAVLLVPPAGIKMGSSKIRCAAVFALGILSHGLLDWAPHCYPIPSKADVAFSLTLMLLLIWRSKEVFRLFLFTAFAGAVFPDVLDLGPAILAKQTGWSLPHFGHVFPWHWPEYSGSVYNGKCTLSRFVHGFFLSIVTGIFWLKRIQLKDIFSKTDLPA